MMKKNLLALVLAACTALSLTACGASSASGVSASAAASGSGSAAGAAASGKTYTVGICQLVQHPALDAATEGFEAALKDKLGDAVTFDSQNAAGDTAACATICSGFASSNVDLIMANATPALQAAAAATATIPILGTSVTDYATALNISDWSGATGKNISGTSDLAPLDGQAAMVKELFPNAKTVGILYCASEANSVYQADTITPMLTGDGYTVKSYTFSDSNDVAAVTTTACSECDVLYIPTDNTAASCAEAINNVAQPAKIPIVAGEEGICKGCGVATLSISYYDLGYATGEMAYEILANGADPATMDIQFAPKFTKEYNSTICTALGITPPSDYTAIAA
jgi:putative ABC transport system substrate-binding protein